MRTFITGLPRSRTAWLANYLTWDDHLCLHDRLGDADSLEAFCSLLGAASYSDPAILFLWERLAWRYPNARWVVIQRSPKEVRRSMLRITGQDYTIAVDLMQTQLEKLVEKLDPLVVPFDGINDRLDEIVPPGLSIPPERTEQLIRANVQLHSFMTEVDRYNRKDMSWVLSQP